LERINDLEFHKRYSEAHVLEDWTRGDLETIGRGVGDLVTT